MEIKRLTKDLLDDYLDFFDKNPHSTNKPEDRCYCVCWAKNKPDDNDDTSTAEKRREIAKQYILEGKIDGYLAYNGEEVIGWCNANRKGECYEALAWRMFMNNIRRENFDKKIKSIYCFTIKPEWRGKGIATALLNFLCMDAEEEGYQYIEAYPNKEYINEEMDFMGTLSMYEKAGFKPIYQIDDKVIMQKKINNKETDYEKKHNGNSGGEIHSPC